MHSGVATSRCLKPPMAIRHVTISRSGVRRERPFITIYTGNILIVVTALVPLGVDPSRFFGFCLMLVEPSSLPAVLILTPDRFEDVRGYFVETWNRKTLAEAGIDLDFVQDNQSFSSQVGTVRGLHFQAPPHAQDKLVRCSQGAIFDVAVDIRRGSPTFGRWTGIELSAENGRQLLVPKGFLHGFITRAPESVVQYRCTDFYAPGQEGTVVFDDPDLGIDWFLTGEAILSPKDATALRFADIESPFSWEGPLPWEEQNACG